MAPIGPDGEMKQRCPPIPMDNLRQVQSNCRNLNDEPRWLIALISYTGVRLSEACGSLVSDIHLDTNTPYIDLAEYPWRLKTGPSKLQFSLVGFFLRATEQISHMGPDFAF